MVVVSRVGQQDAAGSGRAIFARDETNRSARLELVVVHDDVHAARERVDGEQDGQGQARGLPVHPRDELLQHVGPPEHNEVDQHVFCVVGDHLLPPVVVLSLHPDGRPSKHGVFWWLRNARACACERELDGVGGWNKVTQLTLFTGSIAKKTAALRRIHSVNVHTAYTTVRYDIAASVGAGMTADGGTRRQKEEKLG